MFDENNSFLEKKKTFLNFSICIVHVKLQKLSNKVRGKIEFKKIEKIDVDYFLF